MTTYTERENDVDELYHVLADAYNNSLDIDGPSFGFMAEEVVAWIERRNARSDLAVLTTWLATRGHNGQSIAAAVANPEDFDTEMRTAKAVRAHEAEMLAEGDTRQHYCQETEDGTWVCGLEWIGDVQEDCDWQFHPDFDQAELQGIRGVNAAFDAVEGLMTDRRLHVA